ncbi:MAG: transcriptional regulator [Candidatus Hydrogenedentes bacterium]|nr:transcriptional regulator [Candidatus Hydrogenedentota bacterium]
MALTRDFHESVKELLHDDPAFARTMLDEAASLFLNGEPGVARAILRDLINATTGFETLASTIGNPSKSIHRMLSANGNPRMDNLAAIFDALRKKLKVDIEVRSVEARRKRAS